ncbi:E3 ubiquitin-protein ligase MBR2-like [Wolffia australiana]
MGFLVLGLLLLTWFSRWLCFQGVQVLHRFSTAANGGSAHRSAGVSSRRRAQRIAHADEIIHVEEIPASLPSTYVGQRHSRRRHRNELADGSNGDRPHSQVKRVAGSGRTEEDILRLLWSVNYSPACGKDADSCSVCLQDYRIGEEVATLPCIHKFHTSCIARWLTRTNACPMCKNVALPPSR